MIYDAIMIRRLCRIFAVGLVILSVAAAVTAHFFDNQIFYHTLMFTTNPVGFELDFGRATLKFDWSTFFHYPPDPPLFGHPWLPSVAMKARSPYSPLYVFIPWWFLLFTSGATAFIIFRATRKRVPSASFPISGGAEPAANATESRK
jgi:hypothetical protein